MSAWRPNFSRTQLIQITLTAFLLGLLLARAGWATNTQLLLAALFCCVLLIKKSRWAVLALVVLALNLGLWRGQATLRSYGPLQQNLDQKVTLAGQLEDDPSAAERYQTEFHLTKLQLLSNDKTSSLAGRIRVRGFAGNTLHRGDVVKVEGKLRPALGNRQGQISFAEIEVLGRSQSPLESLRRRFFASVYTVLPDPQGSLGLGFLVGLRALLPDELLTALSVTGLTHIVAVSGYNLTILVRLTRRLFAGYSRYLATITSVGLIVGFMAVTGISPSIFRAAIVSGFSLLAWYYGRPLKPLVIILLAAAITAAINPGYLWYDIGWYLSFLAFAGVLLLAPAISARWFKSSPSTITQLLIETTSAQIMTLPLIMLIFGEVSQVALPANLFVLPLIPLAMLLTFLAGAVGMWLPAVADWLALPANGILKIIVWIVERLAAFPGAEAQLTLTNGQLITVYASILLLLLALRHRIKAKLDPYYSVVK